VQKQSLGEVWNWMMTSCVRNPHHGQPPCHGGGALHRWPERFLKSGGKEPTKSWPNSCRQIATRYQCSCAGFGFTADYGFIAVYLRLYSRLFTASQPSTAL